ncbi:MAG: diguanylate cyclase [Candidatus Thiodiazotropha sp. LLP2]
MTYFPVDYQYEHWIVDQEITCTANKISQQLRLSDLVARINGEEFAALFPDCGKVSALQLTE